MKIAYNWNNNCMNVSKQELKIEKNADQLVQNKDFEYFLVQNV